MNAGIMVKCLLLRAVKNPENDPFRVDLESTYSGYGGIKLLCT
jgi:hypothetical protein